MAFSSWFSRLRSSSRPINYTKFRHSFSHTTLSTRLVSDAVGSANIQKPHFISSWINSLLPMALAVSAGSLAFESHHSSCTSCCEAPNPGQTGKSFGGKGSTEYLVTGRHKNVPEQLLGELKAVCKENMTMDYDERYFHGKPQHSFHKAVNIPDIVVYPRSEEEVSKIIKSCNKHKVPIVPYGGATSIEGHTLSPNGGVCIDMSLMKV